MPRTNAKSDSKSKAKPVGASSAPTPPPPARRAVPDSRAASAPDRLSAAASPVAAEPDVDDKDDESSFHECSVDLDAAPEGVPVDVASGIEHTEAEVLPAESPVYHKSFLPMLPNIILGAAGVYRTFIMLLSSIFFLFVQRDENEEVYLPPEAVWCWRGW
jgi:hypothetical protein